MTKSFQTNDYARYTSLFFCCTKNNPSNWIVSKAAFPRVNYVSLLFVPIGLNPTDAFRFLTVHHPKLLEGGWGPLELLGEQLQQPRASSVLLLHLPPFVPLQKRQKVSKVLPMGCSRCRGFCRYCCSLWVLAHTVARIVVIFLKVFFVPLPIKLFPFLFHALRDH